MTESSITSFMAVAEMMNDADSYLARRIDVVRG